MSLQRQLQEVQRKAGLTCADLAHAFRVHFATMRGWLVDGRTPAQDVSRPLERVARLAARHGKELLRMPERKRSARMRSLLKAR